MKNYELAVLIKPLLPEDVQEKVIPAIVAAATKLDGEAKVKLEWGKKHLAYLIEGHEEGYYVFFTLTILPENIKKLEKSLKTMNDLMRFMVLGEDQL